MTQLLGPALSVVHFRSPPPSLLLLGLLCTYLACRLPACRVRAGGVESVLSFVSAVLPLLHLRKVCVRIIGVTTS